MMKGASTVFLRATSTSHTSACSNPYGKPVLYNVKTENIKGRFNLERTQRRIYIISSNTDKLEREYASNCRNFASRSKRALV